LPSDSEQPEIEQPEAKSKPDDASGHTTFNEILKDSIEEAESQKVAVESKGKRILRKTLIYTVVIIVASIILSFLGLDKKIIGLVALLLGFVTQLFAGLVALIGMVPLVGPILVKVLTLPLFILINGVASMISIFLVRRGLTTDVVHARMMALVFIFGLTLGILIGIVVWR
jgi:hypothetical protein